VLSIAVTRLVVAADTTDDSIRTPTRWRTLGVRAIVVEGGAV